MITTALRKSFVVEGRTSRREFWCYLALTALIHCMAVLLMLEAPQTGKAQLLTLIVVCGSVVLTVPTFAMSVRRLHDVDVSGCGYFVNLVPGFGTLIFLKWMIKRGTQGHNPYGEAPYSTSQNTNRMAPAKPPTEQQLNSLTALGDVSDREEISGDSNRWFSLDFSSDSSSCSSDSSGCSSSD